MSGNERRPPQGPASSSGSGSGAYRGGSGYHYGSGSYRGRNHYDGERGGYYYGHGFNGKHGSRYRSHGRSAGGYYRRDERREERREDHQYERDRGERDRDRERDRGGSTRRPSSESYTSRRTSYQSHRYHDDHYKRRRPSTADLSKVPTGPKRQKWKEGSSRDEVRSRGGSAPPVKELKEVSPGAEMRVSEPTDDDGYDVEEGVGGRSEVRKEVKSEKVEETKLSEKSSEKSSEKEPRVTETAEPTQTSEVKATGVQSGEEVKEDRVAEVKLQEKEAVSGEKKETVETVSDEKEEVVETTSGEKEENEETLEEATPENAPPPKIATSISPKDTSHNDGDYHPMEMSDEGTDVEDAIPLPSSRTRKLHRLMRKTRRDRSVVDDSDEEGLPVKEEEPQRATSGSRSRKVSVRGHKDASGRSVLQRMCAKGNYEEAKRLVEGGADVSDADYAGTTPLHEAALEGYEKIVRLLLDYGADVDQQSGQMDRDTALIDATSNLHYDVVKLLVDRGADPTIVNAQGDTALDTLEDDDARDVSSLDEDELNSLRKLKKLLALYTKEWRKTHGEAKSRRRNSSAHSDSEEEDSIARRRNNNTFFDFFTREGRSEIYNKVAENDVTYVLNYVSNLAGGKLPPDLLTLAAKHGHTDIASLLLAFGAKVNYHDRQGRTPLMYAVGKDHLDMVKLLLENDANVLLKDEDGRTALDISQESDVADEEEMRVLREAEAKRGEKGRKRVSKKVKRAKKKRVESEEEEEVEDKVEVKKVEKVKEKSIEKEPEPEPMDVDEEEKEVHEEREVHEEKEAHDDIDTQKKLVKRKSSTRVASLSGVPSLPPLKRRKTENLSIVSLNTGGVRSMPSSAGSPTSSEGAQERSESKSRSGSPVVDLQKARESLESERQERKRARQQQIAKRIEEMEKQRAAELKAQKDEEVARKRKEEEAAARRRDELEAQKLAKREKETAEKKRLIRSYYPYGVQVADFGKVPARDELLRYLPMYSFELEGVQYCVDVQVCLILGTERLQETYSGLSVADVAAEHKPILWNLLWPMIGSFVKQGDGFGIDSLRRLYESEERGFLHLQIHWIRVDELQKVVESHAELAGVKQCLDEVGFCQVMLPERPPERPTLTERISSVSSRGSVSDTSSEASPLTPSMNLPFTLEKKAKRVLGVVKKIW